jgi:hypothetical protein
MPEMPLSDKSRLVALLHQAFRQRDLVRWQSRARPRLHGRELKSEAHRRPARQHRRSRGRADRGYVEALELESVPKDSVDVGRIDVATVNAEVGPAQIVGHEHNDVGSRANRSCKDNEREQDGRENPRQYISMPPLTSSVWPVIQDDRSEAKKSTAPEISSESGMRPSGICDAISS